MSDDSLDDGWGVSAATPNATTPFFDRDQPHSGANRHRQPRQSPSPPPPNSGQDDHALAKRPDAERSSRTADATDDFNDYANNQSNWRNSTNAAGRSRTGEYSQQYQGPRNHHHHPNNNSSHRNSRHRYNSSHNNSDNNSDQNFEYNSSRRNRSRSRSPSHHYQYSSSSFKNYNDFRGDSSNYHRNSSFNSPNNSKNFANNTSHHHDYHHNYDSRQSRYNSQQQQLNGHNIYDPIVLNAFQKLITDATLGMIPGENEMLSFKQFVAQSQTNFSECEAIRQYDLYRRKFREEQVLKFFNMHKDFEWFQNSYNPLLHSQLITQQQLEKQKRLKIFFEVFERFQNPKVDDDYLEDTADEKTFGSNNNNLEVSIANQAKLNEFLELISIMIEGGTESDLENLNQKLPPLSNSSTIGDNRIEGMDDQVDDSSRFNDTFHRNTGLYIRDFSVELSVRELMDFGAKYEHFKRCHVQKPNAFSQYKTSKVWMCFAQSVPDISAVCADFSKHVFSNGKSFVASVTRPLMYRVRPVSGICNHREVMIDDLRRALQLVLLNDCRWGFFQGNAKSPDELSQVVENPNLNDIPNSSSHNPLIDGVTNLIVDESCYEESLDFDEANEKREEKLEEISSGRQQYVKFATDEKLKEKLDALILYLRCVHSIDFYTSHEVECESRHPLVLSVFHCRGDSHSDGERQIVRKELNEYVATQQQRFDKLLQIQKFVRKVSDADLKTEENFINGLLRNSEEEKQKFIVQKSQEITADKWLCLLCSKKFRDSQFLAKHITNKHQDLLEKIDDECQLFNNYLMDPSRPTLSRQSQADKSEENLQQLSGESAVREKESFENLYNETVSRLTSQPLLMATLINQVVLGQSSLTFRNAQRLFSSSTQEKDFNLGESRPILAYTDVDRMV